MPFPVFFASSLFAAFCAWIGFANPLYQLPAAVLVFPAVLYLLGLYAKTTWQAIRQGWVCGMLAYSACFYWVAIPVHDYAFAPWYLAAPCPVILGFVMGAYTAAFSLGVHFTKERLGWFFSALFAASLWASLEWFRGWFLTGFPWCVLSSAFSPWPVFIQAANILGAYGLAGLYALIAVFLATPLSPGASSRIVAPMVLAVLLLGGAFGYGALVISDTSPETASLHVAVAQGSIDQSSKWDKRFQVETVNRYEKLSRDLAAAQRLELIVWPETAMPFYFQEDSKFTAQVKSLARELGTAILTGAPGYVYHKDQKNFDLYNRAYLVDKAGANAGIYEKEHLVPFGEYVPYGEYFPFIGKMVNGIGDFKPGRHVFPIDSGILSMGMLVCYEIIFPELAQKRVQDGANVLVNISNDAWYGRSSASYQHLQLAVLRAVEQHRYLLRATNTGVSAIVDPYGRVLTQTPLYETVAVQAQIQPLEKITIYHTIHSYLAPIFVGLAALLLVVARLRTPKRTQT